MTAAPRFLFALLFLSATLASAFFQTALVDDAARHNDALSFQRIRKNIYNASEYTPTREDPLKFFAVKAHALYPSVGYFLDYSRSPRLLWGWSYDVWPSFSEGRFSDCGDVRTLLYHVGALERFYGFASLDSASPRSELISGSVWKIPFSEAEFANASVLTIWVIGRLWPKYVQSTQILRCYSVCAGGSCWVERRLEEISQDKYFYYEAGSEQVSYFLANSSGAAAFFTPFPQKRSLRMPWMDAFLLSNASFAGWAVFADGARIASQRFLSFNVSEDAYAVQHVKTIPANENFSTAAFQTSDLSSSKFRFAKQLKVNDARVGAHNYSFAFQDAFGRVYSQNVSVETQDAALLSVNVSKNHFSEGEQVLVEASLKSAAGNPLPSKTLRFSTPSEVVLKKTDARGAASVSLAVPAGIQAIEVRFDGSAGYPPVYARRIISVADNQPLAPSTPRAFDWLFLPVLLVLGLAASRFE